MNARKDVASGRLLDLFPVAALRSAWKLPSIAKDKTVDQIVQNASQEEIVEFACRNFGQTKQHVHLLSFEPAGVESVPDNPLGLDDLVLVSSQSSKSKEFFYLLDLRFEVVLPDSLQRTFIDFKWPVCLVFQGGVVQVKFVIMEKDLRARVTSQERVIVRERSLTEDAVIGALRGEMDAWEIGPYDVNRGVKALWQGGAIDCPYARYKKDKSTSTEAMDENLTLKKNYPKLYEDILKRPLLKMKFTFNGDEEDEYVPHFFVNPTEGVITFPLMSDRPDRTANVVGKILKEN